LSLRARRFLAQKVWLGTRRSQVRVLQGAPTAFVDVADGRRPAGGLIQGSDGNLYGTALHAGDDSDGGTVFQITPDGALATLYVFEGGHDDAHPLGLVQASDENLFGTSEGNNNVNSGTIFQIALGRMVQKSD
jgi:uncharacterized repeat protein (TIGR03803 family)